MEWVSLIFMQCQELRFYDNSTTVLAHFWIMSITICSFFSKKYCVYFTNLVFLWMDLWNYAPKLCWKSVMLFLCEIFFLIILLALFSHLGEIREQNFFWINAVLIGMECIDGLVREKRNSSALTMELCLSSTKLSISSQSQCNTAFLVINSCNKPNITYLLVINSLWPTEPGQP